MNKIDETFHRLKKEKKKALVAYVTAGYPILNQQKILSVLQDSGADIIELGVPFSDPIADGPTIQFSSNEALKKGATLKGILRFLKTEKNIIQAPIVLMSYLNPIFSYGQKQFSRDAGRAGVSGLIVPDLIPEESGELEIELKRKGIYLIHLVAPTTAPSRMKYIANKTGGFLYVVSVSGVTGARKKYSAKTVSWIKSIRRLAKKPICVGFGVSGPPQIRVLKKAADGFIVGSAIVEVLRRTSEKNRSGKLASLIKSLAKECHHES